MSIWFLLSVAIIALDGTPTASSFAVVPMGSSVRAPMLPLYAKKPGPSYAGWTNSESSYDPEDEVKRRLAKAKEVLARSKEKLEKKEAAEEEASGESSDVPFFAAKEAPKDPNRREKMLKATDEKTGLVTADGEKMAAMSENEEWERRSLFAVFENELEENEDVYSDATKGLRERDVAASIWNLRRRMKVTDYLRIFDKNNFFIGEDN